MATAMTKAPTRRAQEQKYMSMYGKVEPAVVQDPPAPPPPPPRFNHWQLHENTGRFYTRVMVAEITWINGKTMDDDEVNQYIYIRRNYDYGFERAYTVAMQQVKDRRETQAKADAFTKELATKWGPYEPTDADVMEFVTFKANSISNATVGVPENRGTISQCCGSRPTWMYADKSPGHHEHEDCYQEGHEKWVKAIWHQTVKEGETPRERQHNPESLGLFDEETKSSLILNWVYNKK